MAGTRRLGESGKAGKRKTVTISIESFAKRAAAVDFYRPSPKPLRPSLSHCLAFRNEKMSRSEDRIISALPQRKILDRCRFFRTSHSKQRGSFEGRVHTLYETPSPTCPSAPLPLPPAASFIARWHLKAEYVAGKVRSGKTDGRRERREDREGLRSLISRMKFNRGTSLALSQASSGGETLCPGWKSLR
jgi:hypothetical protein